MPPKKPVETPGEEPREKKLVSLQKGEYQNSLNARREEVAKQRTGYIDVTLRLPFAKTEVHLPLRCTDAYIIGFLGKDGKWYRFEGEEKDSWAKNRPSCGVEGNYNKLKMADKITASLAKTELPKLAEFKSGDKLEEPAVVIAAAVVSESLRFAEVAKPFTMLFDRST